MRMPARRKRRRAQHPTQNDEVSGQEDEQSSCEGPHSEQFFSSTPDFTHRCDDKDQEKDHRPRPELAPRVLEAKGEKNEISGK
jgi:hypothetical protein